MTSVHHDSVLADDARRQAVYAGDLFLSSSTAATVAFCDLACGLAEEAFDGLDPELAQDHLPVERYAEILSSLKPRFIHDARSKEFIRSILEERGCDLEQTFFDVPRLRTSTSHGYLTSGIAYAWHPHRDTWYSAPMNQLNFWMPVYPVESTNAMAFHPAYFASEVPNSSAEYNYYEWNAKYRASASSNVTSETRPLPGPINDVDISNPLVLLPAVGGLIEFSGQHLHSSVPNTSGRTRYSIDFRTVHIGDIVVGASAPNVDTDCSGSSIRDFMRASDFAPMPERIVQLFDDGTENRGDLLYTANPEHRSDTPRHRS
jgi:hypothetical protein